MKPVRARPRLTAVLGAAAIAALGVLHASPSFSEGHTTIAALAGETHFHGIGVSLADSSQVYLATHHGLYVVGADGKARRISRTRDDFMGFTVHPTDAATLFASFHPASGGNLGFIASKDGGRSWTKLSNGIAGPVDFHQMDVSKADPRVIYGVYRVLQRSADGGRTWEAMASPPNDIVALAASSNDADTLYAATQSGLKRSTDGGRTWKSQLDGPAATVHVARDGTVYAFVIGMGLVRASEKSFAWRVVGKGFGADYVLHLAADPRDPQRLYAVTYNARTRTQSVMASQDGGERWTKLGAN